MKTETPKTLFDLKIEQLGDGTYFMTSRRVRGLMMMNKEIAGLFEEMPEHVAALLFLNHGDRVTAEALAGKEFVDDLIPARKQSLQSRARARQFIHEGPKQLLLALRDFQEELDDEAPELIDRAVQAIALLATSEELGSPA